MNYLAHLLLSEPSADGWAGAVLGDFVKGSLDAPALGHWPSALVDSIRLHRAVDSFTDAHPLHARSRRRFEAPLRRYAGIIVDLGYDHFLARQWPRYGASSLDTFATDVYRGLVSRRADLPTRAQQTCDRMVQHDWLRRYADPAGLDVAFERVASRLSRQPSPLALAGPVFRAHYAALERDFESFFPQLQAFVAEHHLIQHR